MVDLGPAAWVWLVVSAMLTLLALLAVAGQTALQYASRPRMRLLADAGVQGSRRVLRMLDDNSPMPSLMLVFLILGLSGSAVSLLAGLLSSPRMDVWEVTMVVVAAGIALLVLSALTR